MGQNTKTFPATTLAREDLELTRWAANSDITILSLRVSHGPATRRDNHVPPDGQSGWRWLGMLVLSIRAEAAATIGRKRHCEFGQMQRLAYARAVGKALSAGLKAKQHRAHTTQ